MSEAPAAKAAACGCRDSRKGTPTRIRDDQRFKEFPGQDERAVLLPRRAYPKYGNLVPRDIATREIFDDLPKRAWASTGGTWSTST